MGAWGIGHFDNDAAGDWMLELEDAGSLAPVVDAFDEVDASLDYLDADIGSIALAAAETVAAMIGKPAKDLPNPQLPSGWRLSPRRIPANPLRASR